jgi:hypothetical protein
MHSLHVCQLRITRFIAVNFHYSIYLGHSILDSIRRLITFIAISLIGISVGLAAPDGSLADTNIKYFGRCDFRDPSQYISCRGGAYIKVNFSGTTVKITVGHNSYYYAKINNGPWISYYGINATHMLNVAQGKDYDYSNGSRKKLNPAHHRDFMWPQFSTLRLFNISTAYIAMFDELNEAASIFKCAENASEMRTNKWLLSLNVDGVRVSSDFYLRLVKDGGQMVKELISYKTTCLTPFPTTTHNAVSKVIGEAEQIFFNSCLIT